ncbi:tol-pal system protein YbgF [Geotalea sp. SG265]|uniref:tol-pal system protein YbgF n=1 Tax=Geotalea sp. SG265 TaxID=2922867 RepID=UPI001FAE9A08|nr:tol-pal system protein YbgF [Geotalea sp. SG265]
MRAWRAAVGAMFFALLAGCGSNDLVVKKQMEMEAKLEQLAQANASANTRLTTLTTEVKELQNRLTATAADMDAMKPGMAELKASIESIDAMVTDLNRPKTSKIEVVNREAAAAEGNPAHQDAYVKAFGLFSANNYNAAIDAFEAFMKAYPDSEYVGNAMYWVGECYYTQHNYNEALEAFSKVTTTFPNGNKVPDAMLKIGYTLMGMNEPAKAKESLQALVEKYPKSQAAAKAREKLVRLSK